MIKYIHPSKPPTHASTNHPLQHCLDCLWWHLADYPVKSPLTCDIYTAQHLQTTYEQSIDNMLQAVALKKTFQSPPNIKALTPQPDILEPFVLSTHRWRLADYSVQSPLTCDIYTTQHLQTTYEQSIDNLWWTIVWKSTPKEAQIEPYHYNVARHICICFLIASASLGYEFHMLEAAHPKVILFFKFQHWILAGV